MIDVDLEKETDETTLLTNHLFGKLPISPDFTIDNNKKSGKEGKKRSCQNRNCVDWRLWRHQHRYNVNDI